MTIGRAMGGVGIVGVCASDGAATMRARSIERIVYSGKRRRESIRSASPGINAWLRGKHLEQSRRAHAAADAHRHESETTATFSELVHELRRQLRPRCAERVTERNCSTVHVDF